MTDNSMDHEASQEVHLEAPGNGGWHHTITRDWIAVCPDIGTTAFRLYAITRSLVIDKRGPVRKLTLTELCHLLPGPNGKPSSLGRIRDAIRELSAVGLYSTPGGGPVTTSSSKRAAERPMLIQINDFPAAGWSYEGPRNAFARLEAIRAQAEWTPGWNSNLVGQNSNQVGCDSNHETTLTSGNAAPNEDSEGRLQKEDGGGDGRRPSTSSRGSGGGGSAASGKTNPVVEKPRPTDIGAIINGIPKPLVMLLEADFPRGLPESITAAIGEILVAEQRTTDQAVERMTRRWAVFGYEDALLSDSGAGIRAPLGVLTELLSPTKCWGNNLYCEDGTDVRTSEDCPRCNEERLARLAATPKAPADSGTGREDAKETFTAPQYVPAARGADEVGVDREKAAFIRQALRERPRVRR